MARKRHPAPSAEIKDYLSYDPDTGVFRWVAQPPGRGRNNYPVGSVAGCTASSGYRQIKFRGIAYHAAKLAWWWVTGEWTDKEIDHWSHNRADDRFDNLRIATTAQNQRYRRPWGASGFKGVIFSKRERKWRAVIRLDGKNKILGTFRSPEEAAHAYDRVAFERFGEFAYLNFPEVRHAA
jgi:hypothetical protein